MTALVLGPLQRWADDSRVVIWVEVDGPAEVAVRADGRRWTARTFTAHDHHYALVDCTGLPAGAHLPYVVEIDGAMAWPASASGSGPGSGSGSGPGSGRLPQGRLRTLDPARPLRFSFGSCRVSEPHDDEHDRQFGPDALHAYACRMVDDPDGTEWPDLLLMLGDQVYADETSDEMREFISSRRDIEAPPGPELRDFEEYAHLYWIAWSEPTTRWLLSTLTTAMIFDDHDVRDDWNTSQAWRETMEQTSWWRRRVIAGLGAYWVYQHLGNLSPDERADDRMWAHVEQARRADPDGPADITAALDEFAEHCHDDAEHYRWSHSRELDGSRLVVVDSRAARVLRDGHRAMIDHLEMAWLADLMRGGVDHLFVATSVPFLLPEGAHEAEAWNEAVAGGAWGPRAARLGEKVRQGVDLEHWGAFQQSFRDVVALADAVADGRRGPAPASVVFLSGDVHHSYLVEVDRPRVPGTARIFQAVCSPVRNRLPRFMRVVQRAGGHRLVTRLTTRLARRAGVRPAPWTWSLREGPWFDNAIATAHVDGRDLTLTWEAATDSASASGRLLEAVCAYSLGAEVEGAARTR